MGSLYPDNSRRAFINSPRDEVLSGSSTSAALLTSTVSGEVLCFLEASGMPDSPEVAKLR
jgi:hypothetical protein